MPLKVGPIKHLTKDLSCPLLGLFGADDKYPSPEQVNELEEELKAQGKMYEFHSYEGAGHAFFAVNRTAYRPEAAVDGWEKIFTGFRPLPGLIPSAPPGRSAAGRAVRRAVRPTGW